MKKKYFTPETELNLVAFERNFMGSVDMKKGEALNSDDFIDD